MAMPADHHRRRDRLLDRRHRPGLRQPRSLCLSPFRATKAPTPPRSFDTLEVKLAPMGHCPRAPFNFLLCVIALSRRTDIRSHGHPELVSGSIVPTHCGTDRMARWMLKQVQHDECADVIGFVFSFLAWPDVRYLALESSLGFIPQLCWISS